jgi:hypothetical protein
MDLQKLVDSDDISFGAEVTVKLSFVVPRGYTHMKPEDLFNEWFSERFPLTIRTYGHAFRDGSFIGNSEEIVSVDIVEKTK